MRPSEQLAQGTDLLSTAGHQTFGKLAVRKNIAINLRTGHRVQSQTRKILQTQIPIAVDLSALQPRLQFGILSGIYAQEGDGVAKPDVAQRLRYTRVLGAHQLGLDLIHINARGTCLTGSRVGMPRRSHDQTDRDETARGHSAEFRV